MNDTEFNRKWALVKKLLDLTAYWDAKDACESPIEQKMLTALVMSALDEMPISFKVGAGEPSEPNYPDAHFRGHQARLVIELQQKIERFRVDFVISFATSGQCTQRVIVECDGHDWHEKTKEQARRDRARDRRLQTLGYRVFRFTGREIHEDAQACADEAWGSLMRLEGLS